LASSNRQLDNGVVKVDVAGRRWYTNGFKSDIVAQCLRPGASVAGVAVRNGLNPNLVRRWTKCVQNQTRRGSTRATCGGEPVERYSFGWGAFPTDRSSSSYAGRYPAPRPLRR